MEEIRIIVDLPNEDMVRTLKINPVEGHYDSNRLKAAIERRLHREFPMAKVIKVNIVSTNAFFGADVMGFRIDEVLGVMKKLSDVIASVVKEEARCYPRTIR